MAEVETVNSAVWGMGRSGILEVDQRLERVKFVIGQGVIVLPAPGFLTDGSVEDGTLSVPDEADSSVFLQIEVRLLDEAKAGSVVGLLDRWEGYHGRRGTAGFAIGAVQGARFGPVVVDGDELELVNTLGSERSLLRRLNADRLVLQRGASRRLGFEAAEAAAVGVDQRGIDLRTRTGVVRIAFPDGRSGDEAAGAFVESLLREGAEGG